MLKTTVFSPAGKPKSEVTLPSSVFDAVVNPSLMAQAVRVHLSNQRVGLAKTKTRSEINRTKAKWFRQKGTGRARHGARSAPIFVGGGVAHGPLPRDWHKDLPIKMRNKALASALTQKLQNKAITVLEITDDIKPKTKDALLVLKNLSLDSKKIIWVLGESSQNIVLAARNLTNVTLRNARQLNTFDVLNGENVLLPTDSLDLLAKRIEGKLNTKIQAKTSGAKTTPKPIVKTTNKKIAKKVSK